MKPDFWKRLLTGRAKSLSDHKLFHHLSLVAFFAWVGLGADGLSSSCYGPEETFLALRAHPALALIVALASALTVFVISASYAQIIELFPTGGGGYLVASKLLSPAAGAVSGCALLIDYVLTITISIASGADALFSLLPAHWQGCKPVLQIGGVVLLTLINLRGAKEAVMPWVPVFLLFVVTHAFAIGYAIFVHLGDVPAVVAGTADGFRAAHAELGFGGVLLLLLRAYSMGAGTYTGIEAVSNGLPLLREPRVETGRRTMRYMAASLAITVAGLMTAYLLFNVQKEEGRTLNASLFHALVQHWPQGWGASFVLAALVSEAALLLIAAQAGFLDGPRVLANMAIDRWFPSTFATLSDRFVTQKGILLMGGAALGMMVCTGGDVRYLVVLYSINVFVTFSLSQLGMVRHWWKSRADGPAWRKPMLVNGVGLLLTSFILCSLIVVKFGEGGWVTLVVTGLLVALAFGIRRHYRKTMGLLGRLDTLTEQVRKKLETAPADIAQPALTGPDRTAVLLVGGFNGMGLHTLLKLRKTFAGSFGRVAFVQVGLLDAGNFKGVSELENLRRKVDEDLANYVRYARLLGWPAEAHGRVGTDVVEEVMGLMPELAQPGREVVFFGGQLVFPADSFTARLLHNHTAFGLQQRLYREGHALLILPIRV